MTWMARGRHGGLEDLPRDDGGDDVARIKVPISLTAAIVVASASAFVAVGGFVWQGIDTRQRTDRLEERLEDYQAGIVAKLSSIDTSLGRIDERLKSIEKRQP